PSEVLNNRWSTEDVIDQNQMTTRTYRGKLRVRNANVNPHTYRGWVVPPLMDGFSRELMRFNSTPDGLTLEYTVVDKECCTAPSAPARKWSGLHSSSTGDGVTFYEEVSVRVEGAKDTSKKDLIGLAVNLGMGQLGVLTIKSNDRQRGYFVKNISL